jgi:hypothetical protein
LQLLHPVATDSKLPLSFVADVTELQNAWERSGKFEGDIMLTGEQRGIFINLANSWANKEVPFVTGDALSEYCSTKIQIGMRGVEGNTHQIMSTASLPVHTGSLLDEVMEIITSVFP